MIATPRTAMAPQPSTNRLVGAGVIALTVVLCALASVNWRLALACAIPSVTLAWLWPSLTSSRARRGAHRAPVVAPDDPMRLPPSGSRPMTTPLFAPDASLDMAAFNPQAPMLPTTGALLESRAALMAYYHIMFYGFAATPVSLLSAEIPIADDTALTEGARLAAFVADAPIPAQFTGEQDQLRYLVTVYLLRHYREESMDALARKALRAGTTIAALETRVTAWLSGYFYAPTEARRQIRPLFLPPLAVSPHTMESPA